MKQYYFRIRNEYNGQATEWVAITEDQMQWLKDDCKKRGMTNVEYKEE